MAELERSITIQADRRQPIHVFRDRDGLITLRQSSSRIHLSDDELNAVLEALDMLDVELSD